MRMRWHGVRSAQARRCGDAAKLGYEIPFECGERDIPRNHDNHNGQGCRDHDRGLRKTIFEMVAVGAIRPSESTPLIVSRANVLEKATPGKFRLIADLCFLNSFVRKIEFKYEAYKTFCNAIEEDDYVCALDLE